MNNIDFKMILNPKNIEFDKCLIDRSGIICCCLGRLANYNLDNPIFLGANTSRTLILEDLVFKNPFKISNETETAKRDKQLFILYDVSCNPPRLISAVSSYGVAYDNLIHIDVSKLDIDTYNNFIKHIEGWIKKVIRPIFAEKSKIVGKFINDELYRDAYLQIWRNEPEGFKYFAVEHWYNQLE